MARPISPSTFPRSKQLAQEHNVAICGKDFKTGQTLMKTILAPAFKARMLGLNGWFSTNILGNRDGEVLEDPGSFKTKEESKLGALEYILQPQLYPELYRQDSPQGPHQLLPAARRQQRRLGQHRHLRLAGLSRCRSRWTSSAAIPSWQRRSFWTWFCSSILRSAPACAAFRNGSASTSSRR